MVKIIIKKQDHPHHDDDDDHDHDHDEHHDHDSDSDDGAQVDDADLGDDLKAIERMQ